MTNQKKQLNQQLSNYQIAFISGFILYFINKHWGLNILYIPLAIYFSTVVFLASKMFLQYKNSEYSAIAKEAIWRIIPSGILLVLCLFKFFMNDPIA